jgi:hypothetical protein
MSGKYSANAARLSREQIYRRALTAALAQHFGALTHLQARELTGDLNGAQVKAARSDVIRTFQTELALATGNNIAHES